MSDSVNPDRTVSFPPPEDSPGLAYNLTTEFQGRWADMPNRTVDQDCRSHPESIDRVREITGSDRNREPLPDVPGYRLSEEIGQGGMGIVYRAFDEELQRDVAVKILQSRYPADSSAARRFVSEARITAQLQHPGIPAIYRVSALADGRPFLAMKLIKGQTLDDRLRAGEEINHLAIMESIAQALGYAHARHVIHRDLKPHNVMIGQFGEVQLMDWGLAKVLDPLARETPTIPDDDHSAGTTIRPGRDSDYTQAGSVMGTPAYMAPEQAAGELNRIGKASDVFGLGAIWCKLLTGEPPFTGRDAESVRRNAMRGRTEEALARLAHCRAEADAVALCQRCLAVEPDDRPGDANQVAQTIASLRTAAEDRAHQAEVDRGKAEVEALAQMKRRHIVQWGGGLIAAVLLAGVGVSLWQMVRAIDAERQAKKLEALARTETAEKEAALQAETTAKEKAETAYARTADVLDSMVSGVTGDSLATQTTITPEQRKFLNEVLTYYREFAAAKGEDEKTRARIADAAFRVGRIEDRLGRKREAVGAFGQARDEYASLTAEFPGVPQYRQNLAMSHNSLGILLRGLGQRTEAEEQSRKGLAIREKLTAEFPGVPEYRSDLALSHNNLGILLKGLGQQTEAEEQHRKALAIREKLTAEFPGVPEYRSDLAMSHGNLGLLLRDRGQRTEAEAQYRKGLAIREKLAAEFPGVPEHRSDLAVIHTNLGLLLRDLGQHTEAEEQSREGLAIREKLAAEFPSVPQYRSDLAGSHHNLGNLLRDRGQRTEAEAQDRKALAIREKLTAEFPSVPQYRSDLVGSHNILGLLLRDRGLQTEAEEQHRKALAIQEKLAAEFPGVPQYRSDLAANHTNLGVLLQRLGQRNEAEALYRKGLAIREKLAAEFPGVPLYRSDLALSHNNLGVLLDDGGQRTEAEEQHRKGLAIQEKLAAEFPGVPEYRLALARSHNNLGLVLNDLGERTEAEEQHRKALAIQEKLVAEFPGVPLYRSSLARSHTNLGNLLQRLGQRTETDEHYRKGLAILEKLTAEFPNAPQYRVDLGESYGNFGLLIRDGGQTSESLAWFGKAIATLGPVHVADPRSLKPRNCLLKSHTGRAVSYERLGRFAEAVNDWDRAVELSPVQEQSRLQALRATSKLYAGQVTEAVAEVAELRKRMGWNAGQLYDFACVYSVASRQIMGKKPEYADVAIELLTRAVKAGYEDVAHMKKDTDLDPLREREEFKKLIAEWEAKAKK